MENNDWMTLNNLVYLIYTTENLTNMRKNFLEMLKLLIEFDSADFYIVSEPNSHNLTSPVTLNYNPEIKERYMDIYDAMDYSKGLMFGGKCTVYRETDIISDKKRMETSYYKLFFLPNNWHYALNMILSYEGKFYGVMTLFRQRQKEDFTYDDVFVLEQLKEHMAFRLFKDIHVQEAVTEKLTVSQCALRYGLTRREETVLRALIDGKTNDEISEEFCISVNTLKKHILNLYKKLGIRNRVQMFKMVKEKELENLLSNE